MDDLVGLINATKFVDVPACEGAAGKGAGLCEHGPYFLHTLVGDIEAFTSIGGHLVAEVPTQRVDILVIEADGM